MDNESKTNLRVRKFVLITVIILCLPVVIFSCHHYYVKSVTKAQIDQFCISTKVLFTEKIDADPFLQEKRFNRLIDWLHAYAVDHPILPEGYAQDEYAFRFIEKHQPSSSHAIVKKRVFDLFEDGVSLELFETEKYTSSFNTLGDLNNKIAEQSQVVVPETETTSLVDLVEKVTEQKDKVLTPLEILELTLAPENSDTFPTIQKAWQNVFALATQRASLEADLEAETGRWYFLMLDELLVDSSKFLANWKTFSTEANAAIQEIEPQTTHYLNLKKGLKRYREFAKKPFSDYNFKAGYNTKIKMGSKGSTGPLTARIKKRLAVEGYWQGIIDENWTVALTDALTHYQQNHQVIPDGVYGRGTAESFNYTMEDRINQIRLAMKRIRHSDGRWENYYVWINIPEMGLEVRENQKVIRKHRIIVGNRLAKNHTPQFSDEIELINFNPSWFVPERIIKEEMQPGFDKDPEFFTKKGYRFKENDEGKILSVTQPPGRGNALGIVKILFPNPHDVYLHDTPTKYLFKRTVRPFSHGCMRLQDAVDLAKFLLEKENNPELAQVDQYLEKRSSKDIYLKNKVPIHVEYVLSSSNDQGEVVFFGDVYKQEQDALLALISE